MKKHLSILVAGLVIAAFLSVVGSYYDPLAPAETAGPVSDHFDGSHYFNPPAMDEGASAVPPQPRRWLSGWLWRWVFNIDKPPWPEGREVHYGPPPPALVGKGDVRITAVGHATFLIQMDGLNILTDPIWSERCSPLSWAGPKRYRTPGIRFEDLPKIDVILISHNHYDHLDLPTLKRLAKGGAGRAIVTLGNRDLVRGTGIAQVEALDWWQEVPLSADIKVTVVPARHFSSRTLWDRNETLWGGFVLSGPSGHVYYAGDTGYGIHFREIARRFSPIRVALLPISPFRPRQSTSPPVIGFPGVHMGPAEAVRAHRELGAQTSMAAHFQVFRLGFDAFDDAVRELSLTLAEQRMDANTFIAPLPGQTVVVKEDMHKAESLRAGACWETKNAGNAINDALRKTMNKVN